MPKTNHLDTNPPPTPQHNVPVWSNEELERFGKIAAAEKDAQNRTNSCARDLKTLLEKYHCELEGTFISDSAGSKIVYKIVAL